MVDKLSVHSIAEAERDRAEFSDVEGAAGAAGEAMPIRALEKQPLYMDPPEGGFTALEVDLSWDHPNEERGVLGAVKTVIRKGDVDLDLGCLYELMDGKTGCLQAFGELYGAFDKPPYIKHSGDERTGRSQGVDESVLINGAKWNEIKRVLIYAYIYKGASDWKSIKPECTLRSGKQSAIRMVPDTADGQLPICALMLLENDNGRVTVTRRGEYFHGHPELDRAYAFGLKWEEGSK